MRKGPNGKRNKKGRFTRSYNPVALQRVVIVRHETPDPFMEWLQNTVSNDMQYTGKDIAGNPININKRGARIHTFAPYDRDAMAMMQTMKGNRITARGLKGLIERICPHLNPQRKAILFENMLSITAAKKSKLDREEIAELEQAEHRARRLSKAERRALREGKGRRKTK